MINLCFITSAHPPTRGRRVRPWPGHAASHNKKKHHFGAIETGMQFQASPSEYSTTIYLPERSSNHYNLHLCDRRWVSVPVGHRRQQQPAIRNVHTLDPVHLFRRELDAHLSRAWVIRSSSGVLNLGVGKSAFSVYARVISSFVDWRLSGGLSIGKRACENFR